MKEGANQTARIRNEVYEKVRKGLEEGEVNPRAKIRQIIAEAKEIKMERRRRERQNTDKDFIEQLVTWVFDRHS